MIAFNSSFLQTPLSPDVLTSALPDGSPQRELVRALPVAWDETIVLPGAKIGRYAPFARRKGRDWWISVLNGDEAKQISMDLSFLGAGEYSATMIADDPSTNDNWKVIQRTVQKGGRVQLDLRASGGFVAWLRPKK
jgi:alpha-glucosidase